MNYHQAQRAINQGLSVFTVVKLNNNSIKFIIKPLSIRKTIDRTTKQPILKVTYYSDYIKQEISRKLPLEQEFLLEG